MNIFQSKLLPIFLQFCKQKKYPKNTILLRQGEVCKDLFFVSKGALRFYYINEQGEDFTHWFLFENDFITEISSFLEKKESGYYLEALEDSEIYSISLEKFQMLLTEFPELEKMHVAVLRQLVLDMGEKIKDLQFRDAKDRYDSLLKKHPTILQRVSLGHIASFLGITQQSLSRIRKQK